MKTFATDSNNDLFLDAASDIHMEADQSAMTFVIKQRLQGLTNELRFDLAGGIIYRETVFSTGVTGLSALRAQMIRRIEATTGVRRVSYLDIGVSGEEILFEMAVITDFGVVSLSSGV